MSDGPIYLDMLRRAPEWEAPHWHHLGDRVQWRGILLRCGIDHYAGADALDPWDPGWGWDARKQSRLWRVLTPEIIRREVEEAAS